MSEDRGWDLSDWVVLVPNLHAWAWAVILNSGTGAGEETKAIDSSLDSVYNSLCDLDKLLNPDAQFFSREFV